MFLSLVVQTVFDETLVLALHCWRFLRFEVNTASMEYSATILGWTEKKKIVGRFILSLVVLVCAAANCVVVHQFIIRNYLTYDLF